LSNPNWYTVKSALLFFPKLFSMYNSRAFALRLADYRGKVGIGRAVLEQNSLQNMAFVATNDVLKIEMAIDLSTWSIRGIYV
jgi:hypothetical protein